MKELFFLEYPLRETVEPATVIQLYFWIGILISLALGFLTPICCFLNYCLVLKFLIIGNSYSYHADFIYHSVAFISLLIPLNREFSLDKELLRLIFDFDLSSLKLPRLYNNLILFSCAGLMYFDSTIYKLQSPFWLEGLGLWLPASFPSFAFFSWNWLLNQRALVESFGYLVILYEIMFVFVFWFKKFRIHLFLIGIALHAGIGIILPIPLFGLIMIAILVNSLPLPKADEKLNHVPINHFKQSIQENQKWFHVKKIFLKIEKTRSIALSLFFSVLFIIQVGYAFEISSPFPMDFLRKIWLLTGVRGHQVFGYRQFNSMKRDIKLQFVDLKQNVFTIPYIQETGFAGGEGYAGRFWSSWWMLAIPDTIQPFDSWAKAVEVWALHNQIDLDSGYAIVLERNLNMNPQWQQNRQDIQNRIPWTKILKILWRNSDRIFTDRVNTYFPHDTK